MGMMWDAFLFVVCFWNCGGRLRSVGLICVCVRGTRAVDEYNNPCSIRITRERAMGREERKKGCPYEEKGYHSVLFSIQVVFQNGSSMEAYPPDPRQKKPMSNS